MARSENQKLKVLHLATIFYRESDPDHGLTMADIIEKLAERGISAERKSLYRDIDALQQFGLNIQTVKNGTSTFYHLAERAFKISELQLITDSVQSSKFITREQADYLISRLKLLASHGESEKLDGAMQVEGRVLNEQTDTFDNLNAIREAIAQRRQVEFSYTEYTTDGQRKLRKNGKVYCETPVGLTYSNDQYYMISFNSKHDRFLTYRVDRMKDAKVSEQRAARNNSISAYDVNQFEERSFSMFGGDPVTVTFRVKRSAMDAMMDRFGEESFVRRIDADHAEFRASVIASRTFYGWLCQFMGEISIVSPKHVAISYRAHLESALAAIDSASASATRRPSTAADMMPPA